MNKELIIERYKKPQNLGEILNANRGFSSNASCGDDVEVYLKIEDGVVKDCKFKASACSICTSTADLLMERIKGMNLETVSKVSESEVLGLIDMEEDSPRRRCATLPLEAVKNILKVVK